MGVVGIVVITPCYSMGGMAHIVSVVWLPCIGSLAPRPEGSGETESVSEARGVG